MRFREPRYVMLRLMFMSRVLLVLVLAVATAACGDGAREAASVEGPSQPSSGSSPETSRAAFTPLTFDVPPGVERGYALALADGTLGGDPGSGCLWLQAPDGTRSPVRFMTDDMDLLVDFAADPFVLRSGEQVLAAEGDAVALTGGFAPDEAAYAAGCPVSGTVFTGVLQERQQTSD